MGTTLLNGFLTSHSCCTSCRAKTAVLDGEVVASDADGRPNFEGCTYVGQGRALSTCGRLTFSPSPDKWQNSVRVGFSSPLTSTRNNSPDVISRWAGSALAACRHYRALRLPGCLAIRTIRRRPGAAARGRAEGTRGRGEQAPRCDDRVARS